MKKLNLNENFICRIWEEKSFYHGLKTIDGEKVEVLDFGKKNSDAGPDYKDAKVKVGDVIYSGSIEIHRSICDWHLHNHKGDNKYNDLILHVVFNKPEKNEELKVPVVKKARSINTVILSEHLTKSIHEIWKDIINNPTPSFKLPCFPENRIASDSDKIEWISRLSFERLKYKSKRIEQRISEITSDLKKKIFWEQALFEFICEALGFSKNKEQFLKLSKNIDLPGIKNLNLNQTETDSLVFGLSGFLNDLRFRDKYIEELKSNWIKLRNVFKKEIMNKSEWNFFRLRPPNFPTLRIAFASGLLSEIINNDFLKDVIKIFEEGDKVKNELECRFTGIMVSDYWKSHYDFGKETKSVSNIIGRERITAVISNVILPFVYLYSINFEKENLRKRAEYFYKKEKQKSGVNEIVRVMENQLDLKIRSMSDEQGLIQLHNFYCVNERCSECEIGKIVFSNEKVNEPLRIILY